MQGTLAPVPTRSPLTGSRSRQVRSGRASMQRQLVQQAVYGGSCSPSDGCSKVTSV